MKILNTILNYIFPEYCIICKKFGTDICDDCINSISITKKETLNWIFPLFDYNDVKIKKIIKTLKYKKRKHIAEKLGFYLSDKIQEELYELEIFYNFKNPIMIPIPLSNKRYKERGFNQSEILCKYIQERNPNIKIINNSLIKHKETKHQADIKNKKDRLINLVDSFMVKNHNLIKDQNIILIDDISTTGATLIEAKKTLIKAGAKKVYAFVVAH